MAKKNTPTEANTEPLPATQDGPVVKLPFAACAAPSGNFQSCGDAEIDTLVTQGLYALEAFESFSQEQVDAVVRSMALAGVAQRLKLARLAVDETGMGVFEDKVTKNLFGTEYIYHDIKDQKTVGVIHEDKEEGIVEIADPIGVIVGITPVTNPTSTVMFKSLIAMKTRNPIIFGFHPKAQACSVAAAVAMRDAAIAAGAPAHCIQWITEPSVEKTNLIMKHNQVSLILATGGSGMVKAAYSSGKPALGVGPGNVPVYIEKTAKINMAVNDIILSKTFDNGTICASEQSVVVDREIADQVLARFVAQGAHVLTPDEAAKVQVLAIDEKRGAMSAAVVGQPAVKIAELAGIKVDPLTKLLIAKLDGVGPHVPLSREKLSPILGFYVAETTEEAIHVCDAIVHFGGMGHSAGIFSENPEVINAYRKTVKTSRILENVPTSFGAIGDIYNRMDPSLTLGCGAFGGNSTSENVSVKNLLNVKRHSKRRVNMKWFKVPPKIYFEKGCLEYLRCIPRKRALIVTDPMMVKLGLVARAEEYLKQAGMETEVFSEVEPDPSTDTVYRGVECMNRFQPDLVVAFGGGSPIDAAKGMWLFYEQPGTRFEDLALRFVDIRKRAVRFPELGKKALFVAIPTTSGTGSEVTAFAVITDKVAGIKYPLADYELTPDIAILDPELTYSVPPSVTADTGMDVLSHAVESYVSVLASDYTDSLALQSIKMLFKYLPIAYAEPKNEKAREKMHNASCMAGMAFTNAFLGINHSLAHKIGGSFHVPHGRANAILLPHVIRYNASRPSKYTAYPKYEYPVADQKYREIAVALGLPADTVEQGVESLIQAVDGLRARLNIPGSFAAYGVPKELFMAQLDDVALNAFDDQCTGANPRYPLVEELKQILLSAYGE
ncbi:TPA: bifunctional acetaldehyde-CoA/alcohol dehydrogenase [Candidatus Sumerlaeota bacterium]|nr:bifunctional acetaldehyde-CoA/alcohol dehydrogenase [Candidatus Sumerlaeota bacterium]